MAAVTRAAVYARVSTADQDCAGQIEALRRHAAARGWGVTEFIDHGVSGAKERRPAIDAMLTAARRRDIDMVVVTKLDRLARSLHQLVALGRELEALGVDLVVLDQAIDTTTPSGRLLFHMLGAIAEFERDLIRERVVAGVRRAQEHGTRSGKPIGRPRRAVDAEEVRRRRAAGQKWSTIARALKVPMSTLRRTANRRQKPNAELWQPVPRLARVFEPPDGAPTR
jgi:DNA invertase Pin-like site-specific DNA recombinase